MITAKTSVSGPVEELFRREKVGCLCPAEPVTVSSESTLEETLRLLRGDSGGCVVVVKAQGRKSKVRRSPPGSPPGAGSLLGPPPSPSGRQPLKPVGIFTERDYLDKIVRIGREKSAGGKHQPGKRPEDLPVSKFMTRDPKTISQEESLDTALQLMTRGGYRHLPLVDNEGNLVGVLSARNIISFLAEIFPVEIINLPPRHDQKIGSREGG